jgi:hypothetical protein
MLGEAATTRIAKTKDVEGFDENKIAAKQGGEAWEVSFRYEFFGANPCRWYLVRPSRKYNHVLVSPHISDSDIIAIPRYNSLINAYPREVKEFRDRTRQVQNYLKSISGGYETDHVSAFKDKSWIINPEKFFNLTPEKFLLKS